MAPRYRAGVDRELPFRVIDEAGRIADQRLQHGGLTGAVASDQRDLFSAADTGGEFLDDRHAVVGFRRALHFERMASRGAVDSEADEGPLDIGTGEFGGLQPFDFFLARRHLRGPGTGRKARDEFVQLGDLLFALGILRFDPGADLGLGEHHVVITAGVGDDRLVVDIGDVSADARSGNAGRAR